MNTLSPMADSAINAVNNSTVGEDIPQSSINSRVSTLNSANSKVMSYLSTINTNATALQNNGTDIQTKQDEINNDKAQLLMYQQTLQDMEN